MAFWGVEVKPSKPFTHRFDTTRGRLHISQATLGIGSSPNKSLLQCNVGNKTPILLCSLLPDKTESCPLNHEFEEEEDVIFSVLGPRSVYLSGFYLDKPANAHGDDDETDSYGEDIGETESEDLTDFGTEDEYEDDFIDDDDIEMSSPLPRPRSGVVIEEISDDEKPANGNGDRKRLKKKYQVSDSDSDDQKQLILGGGSSILELESEDEDALPISSLSKAKDETRQEKPDKKVSKKKAEDGRDQVAGTKRKSHDVQDVGAERRIDEMFKDSTASFEALQGSHEKPKKKKRKERIKEGKTCGVGDDNMVDIHEDKNVTQEEVVRDEKEEKPSTDKGIAMSNDSTLPPSKALQGSDEKPKKKKKKERTKEGKTRGVGDDNMVDVEEEKVKIDKITREEAVRDEEAEKPSNDKSVEIDADEDATEKKKKKKKHKKNKMRESEEKANTEEAKESVVENEDRKSTRESKYKDMSWKDLVRLANRR